MSTFRYLISKPAFTCIFINLINFLNYEVANITRLLAQTTDVAVINFIDPAFNCFVFAEALALHFMVCIPGAAYFIWLDCFGEDTPAIVQEALLEANGIA